MPALLHTVAPAAQKFEDALGEGDAHVGEGFAVVVLHEHAESFSLQHAKAIFVGEIIAEKGDGGGGGIKAFDEGGDGVALAASGHAEFDPAIEDVDGHAVLFHKFPPHVAGQFPHFGAAFGRQGPPVYSAASCLGFNAVLADHGNHTTACLGQQLFIAGGDAETAERACGVLVLASMTSPDLDILAQLDEEGDFPAGAPCDDDDASCGGSLYVQQQFEHSRGWIGTHAVAMEGCEGAVVVEHQQP